MSLFNRGLLITYNLWDSLSWKKDQFTLYEIQKRNKRFIRRLEKKCNVHQRQGLERFVVIETDKPRNHCHLIMETPIHLSKEMMLNNIHESLDKTKGLLKIGM